MNGPSAGVRRTRLLEAVGDEEVQLGVRRLDARDRGLDELVRRDVARAHLRGEGERVVQGASVMRPSTIDAPARPARTCRRRSGRPRCRPRSPSTSSTLPIRSPFASTTSQPGSISSQETGSAIRRSARRSARPAPASATGCVSLSARSTVTRAADALARRSARGSGGPSRARRRSRRRARSGSGARRRSPSRRGFIWMQRTAARST